ncbi:MAG: hypothetical protein OES79_07715 [Planctomycetota bacterium]|nr:hypothetical protein [Planctomycetota bacterium]
MADVKQKEPASNTGGFRKVAARISSWTTNLLVSAVVVLIALLLGGRLLELWRPTADVATTVVPSGAEALSVFDDPHTPLQLDFGQAPLTVSRQMTRGGREQALQQLRQTCASQLAASVLPAADASRAEQRLLQLIRSRRPLLRPTEQTALYQLDPSFPVTIGTISATGPAAGAEDGKLVHRVVVWGLAVPRGDDDWSLYTFRERRDPPDGSAQESFRSVPVPPGVRHLMTIAAQQQTIVAFQGIGDPGQWATFYDDWFQANGWQRPSDWRRGSRNWLGRYRSIDDRQLADVSITKDVQPTDGTEPGWRGLITKSIAGDNQQNLK